MRIANPHLLTKKSNLFAGKKVKIKQSKVNNNEASTLIRGMGETDINDNEASIVFCK
jgi:hypothetical protein